MEEVWKDIEGYEGLYQVSNLGRVKSLGNNKTRKEKVLRCRVKGGYLFIDLHKNGELKTFKVSRLVAQAFISNPENKPIVDHINTIRTDDRIFNLRWCTQKENMNNPLTKQNFKGRTPSNKGKHWKLDPITNKRVWY